MNYYIYSNCYSIQDSFINYLNYFYYNKKLREGKNASLIELHNNDKLFLNNNEDNFFISLKDIPGLNKFNKFIDLSKNSSYLESEPFIIEDTSYTSLADKLLIPTDYNDLDKIMDYFTTNDPEFQNIIIPFFNKETYKIVMKSSIKYRAFKIKLYNLQNFTDFPKLIFGIKSIISTNKDKLLLDMIYKFFKLNFISNETQSTFNIYNEEIIYNYYDKQKQEQKEKEKQDFSLSPIFMLSPQFVPFLIPSYRKKCGISKYQENLKSILSNIQPNIYISNYTKLSFLPNNDKIFIHYEPGLYNGSNLSNDNYLELEKYIDKHKATKFYIYFHGFPDYSVEYSIDYSYEQKCALRLAYKENVIPILFGDYMKDKLLNNISKKHIIQEHGFYGLKSLNSSGEFITFIGFNSKGKNNNDIVKYLYQNTNHNMLFIGTGYNIYNKNNDPRLMIKDDFYEDVELLELLSTYSNAIICNRIDDAISPSGSYRFAVSTGIPTIAYNTEPHTSFLKTLNVDMEMPFFDKIDQIPELIEEWTTDKKDIFVQNSRELVLNHNIGKLFLSTFSNL
jgi:hypothetical protein